MTAYYNEIEPYAAQWLRNLIKAGHIADGAVDTRSIVDVRSDDLAAFTQCHFFAGIGGWSHALRLAGWPDDRPIWTGSCPCQPFSVAGKGAGTDDPRHLWPHFNRLISAVRPPVVMGEQVAGAAGYGWLDGVRADLERENYASRGVDIPACAVDAPHIRQRLYWVASDVADAADGRLQEPINRLGSSSRTPCREGGEQADGLAGHGPEDVGHMANAARGRDARSDQQAGVFSEPAQCSSRHGGSPMADADNAKRWPHAEGRRDDDDGQNARREEETSGRQLGGTADDSYMADADLGQSGEGRGDACEVCGVPVAECGAKDCAVILGGGGGKHGSFWSDHIWLTGADGKARRAQPGISLLAYGIPNRVGRLRAYGNAIVPQVAAEVIKAFMDCEP